MGSTRVFNRISFINQNVLLKESLNHQGNILIGNEKKYYKFINGKYDNFPKIYKYNRFSFEMEYLKNAKPISHYYTNNLMNRYLLQKIFDSLAKLHSTKTMSISKKQFDIDIYTEIKEKIYNRLHIINDLINFATVALGWWVVSAMALSILKIST